MKNLTRKEHCVHTRTSGRSRERCFRTKARAIRYLRQYIKKHPGQRKFLITTREFR